MLGVYSYFLVPAEPEAIPGVMSRLGGWKTFQRLGQNDSPR